MSVENAPNSVVAQARLPDWLEFAEGGLFDIATRWVRLAEAWERVQRNNGAAGGDGVTVARFAQGAEARLSRLSHDLRAGRWRPSPYRRVLIPKDGGGHRPLDIPAIIDRVVHAAIGLTLSPVLDPEFEDGSFAYRPGRSVAQAVARVGALRREGFRHVLDADIRRFFEQVDHARLIARLERSVEDLALVDLIGLVLEHHSHEGRGLPQGSPLSPLLANLVLDDMDGRLSVHGMRIVRFADDFLVLCKTEALARNAREQAAALLMAEGLELNPEKTRLVSFDQGFRFLGHMFVKGMIWKEVEADDTPGEALLSDAPPEPDDTPEAGEEDFPPGRHAPRQRVLYVLQAGRRLAAEGESFQVEEPDGSPHLSLPHRRVDRIELGPETEVTRAALDLAAATDTRVARVDGFGRLLGQWAGPSGGRAALQLRQAGVSLDPARRLALARILVEGRITSQRQHLKRLTREETKRDPEVTAAQPRFKRLARGAALNPRLDSVEKLMGEEGAAGALYWPLIARILGRP
jgi:CRISP-associated protein Cas1